MKLDTYQATTTSLFVEHLTVIDFSYLCPERGLLGESWIVDIELLGQLNQHGMIFDFGHVKKQIKQTIDKLFDHRLLVPTQSPSFATLEPSKHLETVSPETENAHFKFVFYPPSQDLAHTILHKGPNQATCMLPIPSVSIDHVRPFIVEQIKGVLPKNVLDIKLNLRTQDHSQPFFQYSHGLQSHDGDCQRIAHGHRSRLEIYIDQERHLASELEWCDQWKAVYIATRSHIQHQFFEDGVHYTQLSYLAQQGFFELTLPSQCIHIVEHETTIEQIANHIAQHFAQRYPNRDILVKAYEGVDKGAIAHIAAPTQQTTQ